MIQRATGPLSIGGVLDQGFKLFRASFARAFALAAVGALLVAPFNTLIQGAAARAEAGEPVLTSILAALLAVVVVSCIVYAALMVLVDSVANGAPLTIGQAISRGARRAPEYVVCGLLYALGVLVGTILLIVPGVILAVYWVFAATVVLVKGFGPIRSLKHSFRIVRGHWWRVAVLLTTMTIVAFVLYLALGIVVGVAAAVSAAALTEDAVPLWIDYVLTPLISGIAYPLIFSFLLASYYDLEVRHEGADLAARIAATA